MKNRILGLIILALSAHNFCQAEEAQFFFLTDRTGVNGENLQVIDSFVYTTEDPAEISFMRKVLNGEILGIGLWKFEISLDPTPKNKNYHALGQPVWNWSFSKAEGFDSRSIRINPFAPGFVLNLKSFSEDPAGWIALNGSSLRIFSYPIQEITDLQSSSLSNFSSRSEITENNGVAIAGFVIHGGLPKTLLIRGMGPAMFGYVEKILEDPKIRLFDHSGTVIGGNDDWMVGQSIENFEGLPEFLIPSHEKEAALVATLWPGLYSVHLISGTKGGTGTGLVEVYDFSSLE